MALEKNIEICQEIKKSNYEIASHGWRWIDYQNFSKSKEKGHMNLAIKSIKKIFGERPLGWYTGRCSPNTLDLVMEENPDKLEASEANLIPVLVKAIQELSAEVKRLNNGS